MASITELDGAKLANLVYGDLKKGETGTYLGVAYTVLEFYPDSDTDLQMALYQNTETGNYVVAFRGTESLADLGTDIQMGISTLIGVLANQFTPAGETLANWIRDFTLSSSNTTIVGHSLGGALAQYFGANTGFETLTYNAYGVGAELNGGSYDNIKGIAA
jgi:hypothetical protein